MTTTTYTDLTADSYIPEEVFQAAAHLAGKLGHGWATTMEPIQARAMAGIREEYLATVGPNEMTGITHPQAVFDGYQTCIVHETPGGRLGYLVTEDGAELVIHRPQCERALVASWFHGDAQPSLWIDGVELDASTDVAALVAAVGLRDDHVAWLQHMLPFHDTLNAMPAWQALQAACPAPVDVA